MLNEYDFHTLWSIIWGKSLTDEAQSSYFLPFSSGFSKSSSDKYCFKPGFPPKMSTLIGIFWFLYPVDKWHLGSISLCLHMLTSFSLIDSGNMYLCFYSPWLDDTELVSFSQMVVVFLLKKRRFTLRQHLSYSVFVVPLYTQFSRFSIKNASHSLSFQICWLNFFGFS